MTNLADFLERYTQEGIDNDTPVTHGPLWTRTELDHETDPRRWKLATKQNHNAHRLYRCEAMTRKGKPCNNGQAAGLQLCKEHARRAAWAS